MTLLVSSVIVICFIFAFLSLRLDKASDGLNIPVPKNAFGALSFLSSFLIVLAL
jgi:hypothetical protein